MKKWLLIMIAVIIAFGAAACGPQRTGGDDNTDINVNLPTDYSATIRFAYLNDPSETKAVNQIVAGFNTVYPNITVEKVPLSSYETQVMGDFGAGDIYDVLWMADNSATMFANEGLLLPLDSYLTASGIDLDDYYSSMIQLGRENHAADGKLYMFPRSNDTVVTFINTDRFADAEVTVPTDNDWTWNDMVNICAQLKAGFTKNNKNYYALDANFEWTILYYALLKSWGGDSARIINAEGLSDWGTPEDKGPSYDAAFETLTNLKAMFTNGYVSDPSLGYNGSLFGQGKAAMWFTSRPQMLSLTAVDMNLKVLPFPAAGKNPSIPAGTTGYGIARGSTKKDAAWAFLKYIITAPGQEVISASGLGVPVLKSLANDEDAAWRKIEDYHGNVIPSDPFVLYPERASVNDYYDSVPAYEQLAYNGLFTEAVNACFMKASNASPADTIRSFTANILKESKNWK